MDTSLIVGGISSVVPLTLDKIEINLDFHIFDNLDVDLLIGNPSGLLHLDGASLMSLDETLREAASATTTSRLENPLAKPLPKGNKLEEVMRISPLASYVPILQEMAKPSTLEGYDLEETLHHCENECLSSPLIDCEPLPVGPYHVGLDHDRGPAVIFHDESLEMENPWAMESGEARTLEFNGKDSTYKHGRSILEISQEPCLYNAPPESMLCTLSMYEDYHHLLVSLAKPSRGWL